MRDSYFGRMRRSFIESATKSGYEVVDLQSIFVERYRVDGERFEFFDDAHWNRHAHDVIADAIRETKVFRQFLETSAPRDNEVVLRTAR